MTVIFEPDDPHVLSGEFDVEGFTKKERARIEKARIVRERAMQETPDPHASTDDGRGTKAMESPPHGHAR